MKKHKPLPFLIESKAISEWLEVLVLNQPVLAATEIHTILKILVKRPEKYQSHLKILLEELTPTIIKLSQDLEQLFCAPEKNTDEKNRKIARLSISLLRYLAILHHNLSKIDETQLNLNLINSLKLSYLCLKQNALIYQRPSTELWLIIGKIYQLASEKNILDTPARDSIPALKSQKCITDILKSILLFNLCKPYYLEQSAITRLSELLVQHSEQLILANQQSKNCLHSWDYTSTQAVQVISPKNDISFSTLFLDSHLLVKTLTSNDFSAVADIIACNRSIIPTLKQGRSLRRKISTGFDSIIEIIEQLELTEKINNSSVPASSITDKFELQPFDHEKKISVVTSEDISHRDTNSLKVQDAIVKQSAGIDFSLIELDTFSGHAEDLIIIFDGVGKPEIAIIRKITILDNKNIELLAETFSLNIDIVSIISKTTKSKGLLYTVSTKTSFILVPPYKYTTGSKIQIARQSLHLSRLLESTENFMLYEVS